jgi:3-hydroxybutyryl-CoA dehydrogenase
MRIAIVGAGTMGHGLALVYALAGHQVALTDTDAATLARAPLLIEAARESLAMQDEIAPAWTRQRIEAAVTPAPDLASTVRDADLIVEAIVEQPDAKRALYLALDALAPPEATIASNTSYLDVFPLLPPGRQARSLIMHWHTPPYLVDLVDIVPGPQTAPELVAAMRRLVTGMGKIPVVFRKFVSGYVANRIQAAIALEVYRLLDDGVVSPDEIDQSVIHGLALRMPILGVLAKADFTGLTLTREALANRTYQPPPDRGYCDALDRLLADGRSGVLSGSGFFDWQGRPPEQLFRDRDRKLLALKRAFRAIGPMRTGEPAPDDGT